MTCRLEDRAAQDRMRDDTGLMVNLACTWEVMARKVGNVHPAAAFADTDVNSFLVSAAVTAGVFRWATRTPQPVPKRQRPSDWVPPSPLARTIRESVYQTRLAVGRNTNLGIILLLAPLAVVEAWMSMSNPPYGGDYHLHSDGVRKVLDATTVEDAAEVFHAIRMANPGGLGDAAKQDVNSEPTVTLLDAMKLAADRDLIARQYANNFADVFEIGVPALVEGFERFGCLEAAIIHCHLEWLAGFPDSLIARKNDRFVAEDVRNLARNVISLGGLDTPEGRRAGVELDAHLRSDGNKLNPGTTADLVAACLFVALRENKVTPSAPFRWNVPDWL